MNKKEAFKFMHDIGNVAMLLVALLMAHTFYMTWFQPTQRMMLNVNMYGEGLIEAVFAVPLLLGLSIAAVVYDLRSKGV